MNKIIFFILFTALYSCGNNNSTVPASEAKSTRELQSPINDSTFVVKDSNLYESSFLNELKNSGYGQKYELIDSLLIVNDIDTMYFPQEIPLNDAIELTGSKVGKKYLLNLTQINYTTINFGLTTLDNEEIVHKISGLATLRPLFFLGSESDEDDLSGNSYLSTEYSGTVNKCTIAIRIGRNENYEVLAKVERDCKNSTEILKLEDSPTFRLIVR